MNQVNRVAVKSLTSRYKIGRTALYERFKQIKIEPEKDGSRSYISSLSLSRLDKLDDHLNAGGSFESFRATEPFTDFPKKREIDLPALQHIEQISDTSESMAFAADIIYKLLEVIGSQNQARSHLDKYRELEEIAKNGWILPTSAIYEVTHFKPRGKEMSYGCFRFSRNGKIGKEAAWKVWKIDTVELSDTRKYEIQSPVSSSTTSD